MHRCWIVLVVVAGLCGCSDKLPPVADADQARSALQTALDAWQKGEKEESLQLQTPPIFVNEPMWRSGAKLVKYEILSDKATGNSRRTDVVLMVKIGNRGQEKQQASYTIDTDPAIVVVRD